MHGYSLDKANIKIEDLIHNSYEKGVSKLIIVTGKGLHSDNEKDPYTSKDFGILKYSVPEYIKNSKKIFQTKRREGAEYFLRSIRHLRRELLKIKIKATIFHFLVIFGRPKFGKFSKFGNFQK